MTDSLSATSLARIEAWLSSHRRKVLAIVVVVASLLRVVAFCEFQRSPVMGTHEYSQMDTLFFHRWAQRIAWEDALGKVPVHPVHLWHLQVAAEYHDRHPEILGKKFGDLTEQEREAAARKIWDRWYGGTRFHQEPLYPYLVAALYRIWGSPEARVVYLLQMAGGVLTVALLFLVTVQLFGDLAALLTAGLAMLWGPMIHYEVVLLRTSFISLAGVALLYCGQRIIDSRDQNGIGRMARLLAFGCLIGAATALKSTLLVFSAGLLVLLFWPMRWQVKRLAPQVMVALAGIVLVLVPIWIRNHMVGAPMFSMTSVGPVTFAGTNVPGFRPSFGWYPYEVPHLLAQVMDECGTSLLCAVTSSIALHDSLADYLALLFAKFAQVWHWYEVPNNTSYYYSRVHSGLLALSGYFVTALLILPAGLVGIAISLSLPQRRRVAALLWYLLCCLGPLVVFYVLSRLRVPLVVAMMPFAAFAIIQVTDRLLAHRFAGVVAPVVLFGVLLWGMARPLVPERPLVGSGPHLLAMHYYYLPEATRLREAGDNDAALRVLEAQLATRPAFIDELGLNRSVKTKDEAVLAGDVFARLHRLCAEAAVDAERHPLALRHASQADRLEAAAQRYVEKLPPRK